MTFIKELSQWVGNNYREILTFVLTFSSFWVVLNIFVFPSDCFQDRYFWSDDVGNLTYNLSMSVLAGYVIYLLTSYMPLHRQRLTIEPILCGVWEKAISEHEKVMFELRRLSKVETDHKPDLPSKDEVKSILSSIETDALTDSLASDGTKRNSYTFVNYRLSFVRRYVNSKSGIRPYMSVDENYIIESFLNLTLAKERDADITPSSSGLDSCNWMDSYFFEYIDVMRKIYEIRCGVE